MLIIIAIVGFAVLTMGRQIFWIFVAGIGFILGFTYAGQYYAGQPPWVILVIGLVAGSVGALMAYVMQKIAAGIAGFLAGWYLVTSLLGYTNFNLNATMEQVLPIIGGIIGALLIFTIFEWSLIVISSLTGSVIIVQTLNYENNILLGLLITLFVLGVSIQGVLYSREQESR